MKDSKDIIIKAINGEKPYRTPIYDILKNDKIIKHFSGSALDGKNDIKAIYEATRNSMDSTRAIGVPNEIGKISIDRYGNVIEHDRWTSWVKKYVITCESDWIAFMKNNIEELESFQPLTQQESKQIHKEQLQLNEVLDGTIYLHSTPSTPINDLLFGYKLGLEYFSYLWFDERELVQRFLDALENQTLLKIDAYANPETSPLAIIFSDVAYKNRTMFSNNTFNDMKFFENVEKTCNRVHKNGLKVIFHSDGDIMSIMDDLMSCGIDGLNPVEKAAGMDVFELRRKYPSLIIAGALDVTHLLPFGTKDEVRKETRKIIDEVGSEGHLLIGSSTEVEDNVPLENYLTFWDEAQKG